MPVEPHVKPKARERLRSRLGLLAADENAGPGTGYPDRSENGAFYKLAPDPTMVSPMRRLIAGEVAFRSTKV